MESLCILRCFSLESFDDELSFLTSCFFVVCRRVVGERGPTHVADHEASGKFFRFPFQHCSNFSHFSYSLSWCLFVCVCVQLEQRGRELGSEGAMLLAACSEFERLLPVNDTQVQKYIVHHNLLSFCKVHLFFYVYFECS
jgi:hypothetical protein